MFFVAKLPSLDAVFLIYFFTNQRELLKDAVLSFKITLNNYVCLKININNIVVCYICHLPSKFAHCTGISYLKWLFKNF